MDPLTIIAIINGLISTTANLTTQIVVLKSLARQVGATDAQLDELDGKLAVALANRRAEQ